MLRFSKISKRPKVLYRMTGLSGEQMNVLSSRLKPIWEEAEEDRLSQRERSHAIGQGRKYRLSSMEDKLLLLLLFYRHYPSDELMGWIFGLDASNICRLRNKIEPLIEKVADAKLSLSIKERIKAKGRKIKTLEELLEVCPELAEVITDATEQTRQRPERGQKRYYSGKKKRHTIKTQITVNRKGEILLISRSHPGRVHDYKVFKRERTAHRLHPSSQHYLDRGYDGASKDHPNCHLILPVKRRRNSPPLSLTQKRFNKMHSKIRVLVEHILSRMKKYQILFQVYRHAFKDYNQRFRNIAALTNFKLNMAAA